MGGILKVGFVKKSQKMVNFCPFARFPPGFKNQKWAWTKSSKTRKKAKKGLKKAILGVFLGIFEVFLLVKKFFGQKPTFFLKLL